MGDSFGTVGSSAGGGGGGPVTVADGADVTQGAKADVAWVAGDGTVVSLLKKIAGAGGSAVSIADGSDVAEGTTTDAAVITDANGTLSGKLRGLVKMFADMWDSANHRLNVSVQNTPAVTVSSGSVTATQATGTNLHTVVDSGSITATQATGTNLHTVIDSGSVTANAGSNLNTSLLALEAGGNLAAIKTDVDKIPSDPAKESGHLATIDTALAAIKTDADKIPSDPAREGGNLATLTAKDFATQATLALIKADADKIPTQGTALTAASMPVNIASDQTVPVSLASQPLPTGAALEADGNLNRLVNFNDSKLYYLLIDIRTELRLNSYLLTRMGNIQEDLDSLRGDLSQTPMLN